MMYDLVDRHGEARRIIELKKRIKELEEENRMLKETCKTLE